LTKKEREQLRDFFDRFDQKVRETELEIIQSLDVLRKQITNLDVLHAEFLSIYRKLVPPEKTKKD